MKASLNDFIRAKVHTTLKQKSAELSGAQIEEIHPDINIRYNSVNVIVGKQIMSKIVISLEEIIKISMLGTFHLLIYVTKNGDENDRSFQTLKGLLQILYIVVSEADDKKCVEELIAAKNLYYLIKRKHLEESIDEEQKEDMFSVLHIDNMNKEYFHSLVLFDDISNSRLFSSEESFLANN